MKVLGLVVRGEGNKIAIQPRRRRQLRVLVSEVSSSSSSVRCTLCTMANVARTNLPAYRLQSLIIIFVNRPFILLSYYVHSLSPSLHCHRSFAQEVKITELDDVPIKVVSFLFFFFFIFFARRFRIFSMPTLEKFFINRRQAPRIKSNKLRLCHNRRTICFSLCIKFISF